MASQGLLRLVPVGPRRKDLSVINFQPCRGELELPVETAGPGLLVVTWMTDAATLAVQRKGMARETLELGDSLGDIGRGTKLELVPTDAQHGKPGDWAYIVSEFKTPPRIQPSAMDATPIALTGARLAVLPATGGRTAAAAGDGMATPAVPRALHPATAGLPATAGASTSQVKRAAEEEAEPATAAAPAVAAPESASKRQKLADADGTASVAGAAVSGAAPPPHDAEMREAGEELGPQQEEQQQEWQQRQQPRELMLYAETQVLDPYGAEESDGNDGGPAPAPTAAEAGAAASPASSDAAPAGEGGDTASEEDAQRRQPPAAALIPPTQVHPGLLFATRSFATMPHMQLGGSGQLSRSFFLQAVGFMEAEEEAEEEEEEVEEEGEAAAEEAAEETLRGHEQQEEQQGQEQPAAAGAGQPGWEQPAEAQPLKLDTAAAAGPLAVPSAVATAAAATAAPPPKPSGRASRPGAGSVAADVVGATVRQCGELLQDVRAVLFDQGGGTGSSLATAQRAAAWLADVDAMQQRSEMRPIVIGVVGDTGAGKSSMLNALLGEEEVLPQNGMRACTACVVEVSYAPGHAYSAEIEFVTQEEWAQQVEGLWHDLLGEDGQPQITRGERNPDGRSMHGAAQAVLESVLGKPLVRRHSGVTLEQLLSARSSATRHLGETIRVREHSAKEFRKMIGKYVDSNNRRGDDVSTWPLVRVCRISHSWPVLATGAMLVDLPGVRDANAARGKVAEAYLRKCSAIWVAADITRAVDNKTAKEMLGDEFRRQMMMDGQFGCISFVCTKADNIMPREAIEGLGVDEICARTETPVDDFIRLDDAVEAKRDQESDLEHLYMTSLKAVKRILKKSGECDGRLQVIRELIEERGGNFGLDQAAPGEEEGGSLIVGDTEDEEDAMDDDEDSGSESDSEEEMEDGDEQISLEKARKDGLKQGRTKGRKKYGKWKVLQLQQERRLVLEKLEKARGARKEAEAEKRQHRGRLDGVKRELQKLQVQLNSICARARNGYSKEQLKRDFREGVEAVEAGSGGVRALAAADLDLPKLEGRCRRDGPTGAFSRLEHTEVPALREHVHDIARRGRIHTARSLAASLSSFVVSTALLLRDQRELEGELGGAVKQAFEEQAGQLQAELEKRLKAWAEQLDTLVLSEGLSPRIESGAGRAESKAVATAVNWGAPVMRAAGSRGGRVGGGLYWGTYKATVKRGGDYTSPTAGEISFNGDLAAPILDSIAVEWDNTFGAKIATHLRGFRSLALAALGGALEAVRASLAAAGLDALRIDRLCHQVLQEEGRRLSEAVDAMLGPVAEKQRDLSRDVIKPTVKEHMSEAYQLCTAEMGGGMFDRMRRHMRCHVEREQGRMFVDAAQRLREELRHVVAALYAGVQKLAGQMLARLASHFSVLWEQPPSDEQQRGAAVAALAAIATQAAAVCEAAGAAPCPNLPTLLAPPPPSPQQHQLQQHQQQAERRRGPRRSPGAPLNPWDFLGRAPEQDEDQNDDEDEEDEEEGEDGDEEEESDADADAEGHAGVHPPADPAALWAHVHAVQHQAQLAMQQHIAAMWAAQQQQALAAGAAAAGEAAAQLREQREAAAADVAAAAAAGQQLQQEEAAGEGPAEDAAMAEAAEEEGQEGAAPEQSEPRRGEGGGGDDAAGAAASSSSGGPGSRQDGQGADAAAEEEVGGGDAGSEDQENEGPAAGDGSGEGWAGGGTGGAGGGPARRPLSELAPSVRSMHSTGADRPSASSGSLRRRMEMRRGRWRQAADGPAGGGGVVVDLVGGGAAPVRVKREPGAAAGGEGASQFDVVDLTLDSEPQGV
ncbi:hypothetical protein CHLNCDRAFT_137642 [Chlorella variabilis]|uniref:Uncharacterized protein n=1 Tax=Chlorella variabilis TaxID=554065 RepID=E1Z459_CHLVA|nr:hypothetical protein CHLNCDRAFT_137642 [Chlorella variabilis]EFN59293.1 hypothetical protein CHLNCDRAFT_137642 [Chlorella variabilis]|eukprot:XP_005851395.1 hypothetical protein CHLNCDRAFT_137642 [Chlorella variabilis]